VISLFGSIVLSEISSVFYKSFIWNSPRFIPPFSKSKHTDSTESAENIFFMNLDVEFLIINFLFTEISLISEIQI